MFTAQRPEKCDPEKVGCIRLSAAESCNPDVTVIDGDADPLKYCLPVYWLSRQERGSKKVVSLSSTHRLL